MKGNYPTAQQLYNFNNKPQRSIKQRLVIALLIIFSLAAATTGLAGGNNVEGAIRTAQQPITGEWIASLKTDEADKINLSFHYRSPRGGMNNSGKNFSFGELQGLTREQTAGARTEVNFRLVREAGTFQCEGFFKENRGAGFWTLTTNQNFVAAMRSRGYDNLSENDLFSAAFHDLSAKFIDDLKSAGFDRLTFNELNEASIFRVTPEYIREMKSAGYDNLTIRQLIEARIFKIDSQYIKEVQAMGFGRQTMRELVEMRIHKITPEFISRMRSMGFDNLSFRELTELSVHKVTPEFVSGIKAEGYASISPREAIELKIHRVDADFIRRVKAKGFTDLPLRKLVELRIHKIIN